MKKGITYFLLAIFSIGIFSSLGVMPAYADHEPGHPASTEETDKKTEEPESEAAQKARTQQCPEPVSLFPVQLNVPFGSVGKVSGIAEYINEGYKFGVGVVLIVAIVMVVWGGFRYLIGSSIGDVARGKEIIRDAIVGMLIVLGAYTILQILNPATTNLSTPALDAVKCQPLVLTPTQSGNTCTTDADCGEGKKCVDTGFIFESRQSNPGYFLFSAQVAAPIRGLIGALRSDAGAAATAGGFVDGYVQQFGRSIKYCSDGSAGSPCGEDDDCTAAGVSCIESWNLCSRESGLPARAPCDDDHECSSGDDNCVGGDQSICRGNSRILTNADLRAASFNLNNLPDDRKCARDHDCESVGGQCSGPAGHEVRFCVPGSAWVDGFFTDTYRTEADQIELGSICFLAQNGIVPATCNGVGGARFTCMGCPSSGERNWERLNAETDPERVRIGSCRASSDLGTACAGGS